MKLHSQRKSETGFTLVELLVVVTIIGIIAAIAVPGLYRARQSGYEASAIGSLRAINSAQTNYASACGAGFYAPSLENLGTPPLGGGAPFISPDLGFDDPAEKSGYEFVLFGLDAPSSPPTCNGLAADESLLGYAVTASPIPAGGWRHFATNTTSTIWQNDGDLSSITASSPPADGTVLQ